jgi:hypothetical protein
MTIATGCLSNAFPGSIVLHASPPTPPNIVLVKSPSQVAGGGGGVLWRPCSFTPIHSLTGPVGQPFASPLWGSISWPGDAPTLTIEPGSPVSDVSLQWCIKKIVNTVCNK